MLFPTFSFLFLFSGIQSIQSIVNFFGYYSGYIKAYGYMFASAIHLVSCWIVVLVTLQRYIAVCHPHQAKKWANLKTVKIEVFTVCISSFLFYVPARSFQRYASWNEKKQRYDAIYTKFGSSVSFKVGYMVVAYYILIYVVPLSILIFTTYKLIRSLKQIDERKSQMTSSSGKKDEVTISLITVVVVFMVCQLTNPVSPFLRKERRILNHVIAQWSFPF